MNSYPVGATIIFPEFHAKAASSKLQAPRITACSLAKEEVRLVDHLEKRVQMLLVGYLVMFAGIATLFFMYFGLQSQMQTEHAASMKRVIEYNGKAQTAMLGTINRQLDTFREENRQLVGFGEGLVGMTDNVHTQLREVINNLK